MLRHYIDSRVMYDPMAGEKPLGWDLSSSNNNILNYPIFAGLFYTNATSLMFRMGDKLKFAGNSFDVIVGDMYSFRNASARFSHADRDNILSLNTNWAGGGANMYLHSFTFGYSHPPADMSFVSSDLSGKLYRNIHSGSAGFGYIPEKTRTGTTDIFANATNGAVLLPKH